MTNQARSTIYIGVTNDLMRRVSEHQCGEISGFTKQYNLNRLVYHETYPDPRSAIAREKQLKRWSRKKKDALIATLNPTWQDLSPMLFQGMTPVREHRDSSGDSSTPLRFARNDRVGREIV